MEDFLARSPAQQSLRIWLSARETNGHLADAKRDIVNMGQKVEQMWTWFDRGKFLLVLASVALMVQPTLIAVALWLLKSS